MTNQEKLQLARQKEFQKNYLLWDPDTPMPGEEGWDDMVAGKGPFAEQARVRAQLSELNQLKRHKTRQLRKLLGLPVADLGCHRDSQGNIQYCID